VFGVGKTNTAASRTPKTKHRKPNTMSNADLPIDAPLPFREYRDEEIAGFFANDHRTFHPAAVSVGGSGRQRIVGVVHSPSEQKPTAAFRTALAVKESPTIPLSTESESSFPPPFGKQARPLASVALAGRKLLANNGRAAKILVDPLAALSAKSKGPKAPCPPNPGIRIDGGMNNFGEKTLENADDELTKVVARWPRLSPTVKGIIGKIIENGE
jgi:hypothetical protein